jgi:hypothetical protein
LAALLDWTGGHRESLVQARASRAQVGPGRLLRLHLPPPASRHPSFSAKPPEHFMAKLIELDLGDGRTVLVETDPEVSVPRSAVGALAYQRTGRDGAWRADVAQVQQTLRGFVDGSVAALQEVDADIERVTLEFGLSLGGDSGVPFIAKGGTAGALKVTVQCNLAGRHKRLALDDDA